MLDEKEVNKKLEKLSEKEQDYILSLSEIKIQHDNIPAIVKGMEILLDFNDKPYLSVHLAVPIDFKDKIHCGDILINQEDI